MGPEIFAHYPTNRRLTATEEDRDANSATAGGNSPLCGFQCHRYTGVHRTSHTKITLIEQLLNTHCTATCYDLKTKQTEF